jgi:hypothetical protein
MRPATLLLALLAGCAHSQDSRSPDADWLASPPAAEFRARVVQLALIYGESNGIDPHDYMIRTRSTPQQQGGCADVEVVTLKGKEVVRRETVHACREH